VYTGLIIGQKESLMSVKCSVFVAASLDGYIARLNGDLGWLTNTAAANPGEDYGYKEFFDTVDTVVLGRKTYEFVLSINEWPYADKKTIVLSREGGKVPGNLANDVKVMSGPPADLVRSLETEGVHHIYVDGGKTIQGFLNAGQINEMTITIIPVLIGEGIPLFGKLDRDMKLLHIETILYRNSLLQTKYQVENAV
jgi:dihydrofolate reductase